MSYVAEPYAQFVDDLLTGLTGGRVRESFTMLPEQRPFRLTTDSGVLPNTVRVYGQIDTPTGGREFRRFDLHERAKLIGDDKVQVQVPHAVNFGLGADF